MPRAVLDTNVLVSAFIAAGPPSRVFEEVIAGRVELVLPEPVLTELERVLTTKLGFDGGRWSGVRDLVVEVAASQVPLDRAPPAAVTGDPDDDAVLACAVAGRADVLVTGDRRHLLPVGEHRGVRILTAPALLAELRA